jgi:hypothetical protein
LLGIFQLCNGLCTSSFLYCAAKVVYPSYLKILAFSG